MKKGQSVLIHGAAGGVGQAAVNIALHHNCEIFVTVGTNEKRRFIREHFPQIALDHIGNSRNTSFEQTVLKATGGRGVDFVLNFLSDEMLQASLRCLAHGGNFLEIRRFGAANENTLNLELLRRGASLHGITLEDCFERDELKFALVLSFKDAVKKGIVKPLKRTVYTAEEIKKALRFMAAGRHIGKVVVRIRNE